MKGRWIPALALATLALMARAPARAQCATLAPVTIGHAYNPLDPDAYSQSFRVTATRQFDWFFQGFPRAFTAELDRQHNTPADYRIYLVQDDGHRCCGEVLYDNPPLILPGTTGSGQIDLEWSDLVQGRDRDFTLRIDLDPGQNLPPGDLELVMGVYHLCEYRRGDPYPSTASDAFTIRLTVASAVRASLVGEPIDFGDIGGKTDGEVGLGAGDERQAWVRVESTGPYEVRIASQNNWVLTPNGGSTIKAKERIGYRLEFLGQQMDPGQTEFRPVRCRSTSMEEQMLPARAELQEGGVGKVPSPVYRDVVTITVTPLAVPSMASTVPCP